MATLPRRITAKLQSQTDNISGEQVVYTYDVLNRLASATTTSGLWGQSYSYDGFGNLTGQTVTAGSAPAYQVVYNAATNQQTTDCADANGNLGSASACTGSGTTIFDVENRMISPSSANQWQYSYAPKNKRVWRGVWNGSTLTTYEVTFWSDSQKLGTWALSWDSVQLIATMTESNYYFGGKLIKNSTGYVSADRLGSIGHFYPYGQEKPSATTNGTEKFTGYFRDSETGLDYAINRYESPGTGRFLTPDPISSAHPADPGTWNRYAYVAGDPVNRTDPSGGYTCYVGPENPEYPPGTEGNLQTPVECEDVIFDNPANINIYALEYNCVFLGIGLGCPPGLIQTQGQSGKGDLTVTNFQDSLANLQQSEIQDVLQLTQTLLPSYSGCNTWLSSGVTNLSAGGLIDALVSNNSFGFGNFVQNGAPNYTTSAITGYANPDGTPVGVPVSAAITVNSQGAFFNSTTPGGGTLMVGAYVGGTLQAQMSILIHELAHLLEPQGFNQNDFGNSSAVASNDKLVQQNCGSMIGSTGGS